MINWPLLVYEASREINTVVREPVFSYAKIKAQISCTVNMQLISAFAFLSKIVESLYFLSRDFKHLTFFCGCTAWFMLDLVGKPKDRFSHDVAHIELETLLSTCMNMAQNIFS